MNNIKGIAVFSDGNLKRLAITYDRIDESGKVIESNTKINRVVFDKTTLQAIGVLEDFALSAIDNEQ